MDNYVFQSNIDLKPNLELATTICRCCLSTEKRVNNVLQYREFFMDLAGINVTESDGLPQWLCWECAALLHKTVKFKYKMLKAHNLLYEYLSRCAPFPIDAQDVELAKYASPLLSTTHTLCFDNAKGKIGYHKTLEHIKEVNRTELETVEVPVEIQIGAVVSKQEYDNVKEETGFSDYEDNITLEEYRLDLVDISEMPTGDPLERQLHAPRNRIWCPTNVTKLTEDDLITEDDFAKLLEVTEDMQTEENENQKKKIKRKEDKKDKEGIKKKKNSEQAPKEHTEETEAFEPKCSLRSKPVELDPNKIRVVTLDPEEQVKQREEESKASMKFPFQCHLCFKGFNFEAKLQNHMAKHRPSRGQFECKLCSMYFPTQYSATVHTYIHTRRYECARCGRRMIDRYSILDHYRIQHDGLVTMYTCHLCGKISNNNKTHRGHMRNHHSGERPSCDQCGKSFINKDSLAEHIQIHQGIKNYSCGTCGKRFRTRTQIKHHQLKHSDARDHYCVECDTRFKSAHSLRQHLLKSVKHKDKHSMKFPCDRCEKRFDSEGRLHHHVSIHHEGIRPYKCDLCEATLATLGSLNKHIQSVHGGRRPAPKHVCHQCGKAFRGKSVLVNHVRTHTGEKPFECIECGRKFAQRTAMKTHVKLVHLKFRKIAKVKPEVLVEAPEPAAKLNLFPKQEPALSFDTWRPLQGEVYFHIQP